jgi:excisionase family DNA binding protein
MEELRLLKPEEISKLFGLKVRQVKELARKKKIPAIKLGRLWRFPEESLRHWIEDKNQIGYDDVDLIADQIISEVS